MTNTNTDWTQTLGHNFRTIAKAAAGFYEHEREKAERAAAAAQAPLR